MTIESSFEKTRSKLKAILAEEDLFETQVSVKAFPLTPEEAIGNPDRKDFPILIGKERMIEAVIEGARGQAFTDTPSNYTASVKEVLDLPADSNRNRAIIIATMNAVLRRLGIVDGTVHCKDNDPEKCGREIAEHILRKWGKVRVGQIGLNPAIAEHLVDTFGAENVKITDLNPDNIGKVKFGVTIWDGMSRTAELVNNTDVVVLTGTTLVNDTFDEIMSLVDQAGKGYLIYGITCAATAHLLGLENICPYGNNA